MWWMDVAVFQHHGFQIEFGHREAEIFGEVAEPRPTRMFFHFKA